MNYDWMPMQPEYIDQLTHKMKITLTYVHGYANMLPLAGDVTEEQSRYIEKILKGVGQLTEMIKELEARAQAEMEGAPDDA
jgi:signal transduction histidine kinase